MPPPDESREPATVDARDPARELVVQRLRVFALAGPATGARWDTVGLRTSLGSHARNDIAIDDPSVSRFHCEILCDARGARVRDLGSKNGTLLDGVAVVEAFVREGSVLRLGDSTLAVRAADDRVARLPISERDCFGRLRGGSPAMRSLFALLERAAASDATVLLEGETGTGKGEAARALHELGARKVGPFVVVDCGAIAEDLVESELFGHERGAFTGALERRAGAFEQADGGTVFLDEIGELSTELQPKLLRVLEDREIRRLGGSSARPVNVRVIAATNRDLRAEVNAGRFRSDLYYRLAVVTATAPPLRQRPEDIPALVDSLLVRLGAREELRAAFAASDLQARLQRAAWPGNVRELRNYLERCVVYDQALPISMVDDPPPAAPPLQPGERLQFTEARAAALQAFERRYLEELLAEHGGKMSQAAARAGIGRVYLYKLLVRNGLK